MKITETVLFFAGRTESGVTFAAEASKRTNSTSFVLENIILAAEGGRVAATIQDVLDVAKFLGVPSSDLHLHAKDGRPFPKKTMDSSGLTSSNSAALFAVGRPELDSSVLGID